MHALKSNSHNSHQPFQLTSFNLLLTGELFSRVGYKLGGPRPRLSSHTFVLSPPTRSFNSLSFNTLFTSARRLLLVDQGHGRALILLVLHNRSLRPTFTAMPKLTRQKREGAVWARLAEK